MLKIIFALIVWRAEAFVVTKYDPKTLAAYFEHLQRYSNETIARPFTDRNLFEFCQLLRQSRIFRPAVFPNGDEDEDEDEYEYEDDFIKEYSIRKETLEMEKNQLGIKAKRFHVGTSSEIKWIPSFECLDENGDLRWYVTPSFVRDSYFLFNLYPNFRTVVSREVHTECEYYPKLIAVIDEPAEFTQDSRADRIHILRQRFTESLNITHPTDPHSICAFNPILRFRLCVIVLDAIRTIGNITLLDNITTDQIYHYRPENQYYEPEEFCPLVSFANLNINVRMLDCMMNLVENDSRISRYGFLLHHNVREPSKIFLVWSSPLIPLKISATIIQQLKIPLLNHLERYVDTLKNLPISKLETSF